MINELPSTEWRYTLKKWETVIIGRRGWGSLNKINLERVRENERVTQIE